MGTKRTREYAMNNSDENLAVPPGFVSLTAFTLKRMAADRENADPMAVSMEFDLDIGAPLSKSEIENFKSSFVHRPWICCDKSDHIPRKYDTEQTDDDMKDPVRASLPKGVTWGCANCPDCVKVTARWHPEESNLPVLNDAPVFRPTEEEFSDSLKYIAQIRPRAELYGVCRIVPPPSWRPPCLLQDKKIWETSKFNTCVQKIDGLQNLYLQRKLSRLHEKIETRRPKVTTDGEHELCNEHVVDSEEATSIVCVSEFEEGPDITLKSFKKNADNFKRQFFSENGKAMQGAVAWRGEPLVARIESEYWRIITNPSEEIEVLCGANLASQNLESGFPTKDLAEYSEYVESGWNLNNITKLPGSLLGFGCHSSSAILIPQLFIGMCFASQFWRTENHQLYSLSYMHMGAPKVWYGIPGAYYFKFAELTKKLFPQLSKHPKLIHELVSQISPSKLTSEGIPVYRCVQNPLEFVLIFPGAYHSGFSCGFNCSESACFATFDWLPHGQHIIELYAEHHLKTSISHDKLLLGAALQAASAQWEFFDLKNNSSNNQLWRSVCGKEGILTKSFKSRVRAEGIRREHLCNPSLLSAFEEFDVATKRECCICLYDLHLSAVGCSCSPNRYSCLQHAKQLCLCAWGSKHFLLSYRNDDLNLLVEALEGNMEAIRVWAKKCQPKASAVGHHQNPDAICSSSGRGSLCKQNLIIPCGSSRFAAERESCTPGLDHQQEAITCSISSPPSLRSGMNLNTQLASHPQYQDVSPPKQIFVLLSDDDEE